VNTNLCINQSLSIVTAHPGTTAKKISVFIFLEKNSVVNKIITKNTQHCSKYYLTALIRPMSCRSFCNYANANATTHYKLKLKKCGQKIYSSTNKVPATLPVKMKLICL